MMKKITRRSFLTVCGAVAGAIRTGRLRRRIQLHRCFFCRCFQHGRFLCGRFRSR